MLTKQLRLSLNRARVSKITVLIVQHVDATESRAKTRAPVVILEVLRIALRTVDAGSNEQLSKGLTKLQYSPQRNELKDSGNKGLCWVCGRAGYHWNEKPEFKKRASSQRRKRRRRARKMEELRIVTNHSPPLPGVSLPCYLLTTLECLILR